MCGMSDLSVRGVKRSEHGMQLHVSIDAARYDWMHPRSRCNIHMKNGKVYMKHNSLGDDVPIVVILRAMGATSDQEIVQLVSRRTTAPVSPTVGLGCVRSRCIRFNRTIEVTSVAFVLRCILNVFYPLCCAPSPTGRG